MEPGHNEMACVALVQWILAMGGQVHYAELKMVAESGLSSLESESDLESIAALFCAFPRGVEYQKEVAFLVKCLGILRTRSELVFGYECEAELRLRDIIHTLLFLPARTQGEVQLATGAMGSISPGISRPQPTTPPNALGLRVGKLLHKKVSYRRRYYKFSAFQSPPMEVKYLPDPRFL